MSLRKRERERNEAKARELLRGRVIRGIHGGHLRAGGRLPSYREVSDETGLDLRAVMRIYQTLADEGLVEVRGRTGVFVAPQEQLGDRVLTETAEWMAGVLLRPLAERLEKPLIVVRLDPDSVRQVAERVQEGRLTVACVDPRYLERIRLVVGEEYADRIHGVLASDREAVARISPQEAVLVSRAAHVALGDMDIASPLPMWPVISVESAGEILRRMIRINLRPSKA
jgi:DNA-binding transcriptional regulator YhcF (GntR family)